MTHYGTIVVCGGGCYGGYYVRQLARARRAGALTMDRILVVDQRADCRVAQLVAAIVQNDAAGIAMHGWQMVRADTSPVEHADETGYHGLPIEFVESEWAPFFARWFAEALSAPALASRDAVVPSPLMPHLLSDWVESRVVAHRPDTVVSRVPMRARVTTPWQRDAPDLAVYASFATWMCPINCIEPPRCPETRGLRDWTMPIAVQQAVDAAAAAGATYDVVALFRTSHRAYGVGMFDVADAIHADAGIAELAHRPTLRLLVGSVSHCHGALAELACGEPHISSSSGAEPFAGHKLP